MADPTHAEFQPMDSGSTPEPSATGEPSRSASSIAAEAAAAAVRGAAAPGAQFRTTGDPLPSDTQQYFSHTTDAQPEVTDDGEVVPSVEDVAAEVQGETQTWQAALSREDLAQFSEMGIDLPISPDEVPAGAEGLYADMAQAILDAHNLSAQRYAEATEAAARIADFAQRLQTAEGQERMLLSLAMQSPEVYAKATQLVERMQTDPEFSEAMRLRMEAQVREEAVNRRERAFNESQMAQKAQQVTSRTSRLAKRLGVDEGWAKEQVAQAIIMNEQQTGKRDISLSQVDDIVKGLARRTAAQPRTRPPAVQERVAQAPQQPAAPAGRTPSAAQHAEPAPSPTQEHWTGGLRNAIRQSTSRLRSSGL